MTAEVFLETCRLEGLRGEVHEEPHVGIIYEVYEGQHLYAREVTPEDAIVGARFRVQVEPTIKRLQKYFVKSDRHTQQRILRHLGNLVTGS